MKKKLLSLVLVMSMILSMFPVTALAAAYNVGDTFTADAPNAELPTDIPNGTQWVSTGMVYPYCTAHTHGSGCYSYVLTCGGISWTHWWHDEDCYEHNCGMSHNHNTNCRVANLTCGLTEHTHNNTCSSYHAWKLGYTNDVDGSNDGFREWWPMYWGFDTGSLVNDSTKVSVNAGAQSMLFAPGLVTPEAALVANTADIGDALANGITVDLAEGYYVSEYRVVCGNHYSCGVTSREESIETNYNSTNYTSDLFLGSEWLNDGNFDHGAYLGDNYPVVKPDPNSSNIYDEDYSNNTLYPAYLLIAVEEDTARYSLDYSWGALAPALENARLPDGVNSMRRGQAHAVAGISSEVAAAAAQQGYEFVGWRVQGTGYSTPGPVVQPGTVIDNKGGDITLVAQWEAITEFSVTYMYTGVVPTGYSAPVDGKLYKGGVDTVTVRSTPDVPDGYTFNGWTTTDGVSTSGTFTMPEKNVTFVGTWGKDPNANKTLSYTVQYWFNGYQRAEVPPETFTETVWVHDPDMIQIQGNHQLDFENWDFIFSEPNVIPAQIRSGSVINFYYIGNKPAVTLDKNATYVDGTSIIDKVKVGDTLKYTITVTNKGTAVIAEDFVIEDTANGAGSIVFNSDENSGISHKRDSYEIVGTGVLQDVDYFTFHFSNEAPFSPGDSKTVTYYYTVHPSDAGGVVINNSFWNDRDPNTDIGADSYRVEVEGQYKVIRRYYLDGVLQPEMTVTSAAMNVGAAWSVEPPAFREKNDVRYAFDALATTDALSGTIGNSDVVVDLYYATDEIGKTDPESPDGTPDKYQITVIYQASQGGTITGLVKEVLDIKDSSGAYANTGDVTATGSSSAAVTGYEFDSWTLKKNSGRATEVEDLKESSFGSYALTGVQGGDVYTFTAEYTLIPVPNMTILKTANVQSAKVGDIVHYEIRIVNTGNCELKNIDVYDILENASGEIWLPSDPGSSEIAGVNGKWGDHISLEERTYDVENENVEMIFNISALPVGAAANIFYAYQVGDADEGKIITNTASTRIPGEDTSTPLVDEVDVRILERKLEVTKELLNPNQTTANVGDTLMWKVVVKNVGDLPIEDITLTDTMSGEPKEQPHLHEENAADVIENLNNYSFNLAVNESKTFIAGYTVQPDDAGKTFNNTIVAAVEGGPSDSDTPDTPVSIKKQYTVTYQYSDTDDVPAGVSNPAASEMPVVVTYNEGDTVTVAAQPTNHEGYDFSGWIPDVKEYDVGAGNTFVIHKNVTFTGYFLSHIDLEVEKHISKVGDTVVTEDMRTDEQIPAAEIGDVIEWTITVTNEGEQGGTYNLHDKLPDVTVYKAGANGDATDVTVSATDEIKIDGEVSDFDGENGLVTVHTYIAKYTVTSDDKGSIVNTVEVAGDSAGTDEEQVPLAILQVSDKRVSKIIKAGGSEITPIPGDIEVEIGDTIEWTITITNTGSASGTIAKADIVDTLKYKDSAGTYTDTGFSLEVNGQFDSNGSLTVPATDSKTVTVTWTVPAGNEDILGKTIVNFANVAGKQPDPVPSEEIDIEEKVETIDVEKTLVGAVDVNQNPKSYANGLVVGDTIIWNIVVKNTGNVNLTGITLTDTMINVAQAEIGSAKLYESDGTNLTDYAGVPFDLAAGEERSFVAKYTIVEKVTVDSAEVDVTGMKLNNKITAAATDGPTDVDVPQEYIEVIAAKLVVEKTLDREAKDKDGNEKDVSAGIVAGDTIIWTITVKNVGGRDLEEISLTDTMQNAVGNATVYAADAEIAFTGTFDLLIGKEKTFRAEYKVQPGDAGKTINNVATATEEGGPSGSDQPEDGVEIWKNKITCFTKEVLEVKPDDVTVPDSVSYPVNNEIVVPAEGVTLLYKITVTGDEGANYVITDNDVTVLAGYSLRGTLNASGEAVVYVIKTFRQSDITNDKLSNTASVAPGANTEGPDEPSSTAEVNAENAAATVTKTPVTSSNMPAYGVVKTAYTLVSTDGNGAYSVAVPVGAEEITLLYAVEVEANGKIEKTLNLKDEGANYEGFTGRNATVIPGYANAAGNIEEVTVNFSAEGKAIVYFSKTFAVTSGDDTFDNSVTVSGENTPVVSPEVIEAKVNINKSAALDSAASIPAEGVKPGDVVVYTVTVYNPTSVAAENVTFADTLKAVKGSDEQSCALDVDQNGDIIVSGATVNVDRGTYIFNIGTVAAQETKTVTYRYTIKDADIGCTLSNSAVVSIGSTTGPETTTDVEVDEYDITDFTKEVVVSAPAGVTVPTGVSYPGNGTVIVPVGGITLLYKLTVTGEEGAAYTVEDPGATLVAGSWSGVLDSTGEAVIYVTRHFKQTDINNAGKLVNTAAVTAGADSEVPGEPDDKKDVVEEVPAMPVTPPIVNPTPTVGVNGLNTVDHVAYIIGVGNNEVSPLGTITRAEVANIYFRLMTDEFRNQHWKTTNRFLDVEGDAWYNLAVSTLDAAGVITDSNNGYFRPNDPITRAELAVMAAQFAVVSGKIPATSFIDVPANHWAAEEIALVEYAGWIEGYLGFYRPEDNLSRAECMTIVNRMLKRGAEDENMLPGLVTFVDNVVGEWYYEAVLEATNSHTYTRTGVLLTGEKFYGEKWTALLKAPDWAALERTWINANSK